MSSKAGFLELAKFMFHPSTMTSRKSFGHSSGKNYLPLNLRIKDSRIAKDQDWKTPLHLASANGHLEIVKILLEQGASAAAKDRNGRTPMDFAFENGHIEIVQQFSLKKGTVLV